MKPLRWQIEKFETPEFCQDMIQRAESIGFEKATITTPGGPALRIEYRHNDRVIFDDWDLADKLFQKIKDDPRLHNPGWECIGLNERLRYTGTQVPISTLPHIMTAVLKEFPLLNKVG